MIDDDPDVLHWVSRGLEAHGAVVERVNANFIALLYTSRWKDVDAALVDFELHNGVNGGFILDWLRDNVPNVRRVLLSGHDALEISSAEATLIKPASGEDIARALNL